MFAGGSRQRNAQLRMQGTDTMLRPEGPFERVMRFVGDVAAGAKRVSKHKLFHRNSPPPPKEASMADQVWHTPAAQGDLCACLNSLDRHWCTISMRNRMERPGAAHAKSSTLVRLSGLCLH